MSVDFLLDKASPIIAAVLKATRGKSEAAIRRALHAAYPFGPYGNPQKVWRDEIKRQRGDIPKRVKVDPRQLSIFDAIEGAKR